MENKNEEYLKEEKGYDGLLAIEEASRCLLCHDAPCSKACPANTDPAKFIRSIRFSNFYGAITTIRLNNPLGGICARVCPTEKYCMSGCIREGLDKPINIGKLQRFATDLERSTGFEVYDKVECNKERIAIIGSGPSGIACANILALNGYQVTIFEKHSKAGGYLTYGIPSYRLPQDVVDYEISKTLSLGVKIVYSAELGKNISFASLQIEGFKAVILATGYEESNFLPIFKDNPYVETAVDFLSRLKISDGNSPLLDEIIVIGGGDVAMDVACSAKKLGVNTVRVVAREYMDEFPSSQGSILEALDMKIDIYSGFTPTKVEGKKVYFEDMKGEGELVLSSTKIVLATGQKSSTYDEKLQKERNDYIVNDYMTNIETVFATGDIVSGDKTVVEAVKKGKECAHAVMNYLKNREEE